MDEVQAAWLAGIIDGEGSITACRSNVDCIRVQIAIAQKSRELLEKVSLLVQGQMVPIQGGKYWQYVITNQQQLIDICRSIMPQLVLKRKQATNLIKYCESRLTHSQRGSNESRRYTTQELTLLKEIFLSNSGKVPEWLSKKLGETGVDTLIQTPTNLIHS